MWYRLYIPNETDDDFGSSNTLIKLVDGVTSLLHIKYIQVFQGSSDNDKMRQKVNTL